MKTVYAESTTTFHNGIDNAPSPTPSTEEVIIPGYNKAVESFEVPGGNDIPLLFHGITKAELPDRPALQDYIEKFNVSDEYGLIYNSVSELITVSDEYADKVEAGEVDIETLKDKLLVATAYTVHTVSSQMEYGRLKPKGASYGSEDKAALSVVQHMQRVVREDHAIRLAEAEGIVSTPEHVTFVPEEDMKPAETHVSKTFFEIVKNLMDLNNPRFKDLFPRSGEIPITVTQTLPTVAIDALGIKKP